MSIETSINTSLNKILLELSLGKHQTLLFNIACLVKFEFTDELTTAGVAGNRCYINPVFFNGLPDASKRFLIKHELWHLASGHALRRGNRDHKLWNIACDIVINNRLIREGMSYKGLEGMFKDEELDDGISEEEVYASFKDKYHDFTEEVMQDLLGDVDSEEGLAVEREMQTQVLTSVLKMNPSLKDILPDALKDLLVNPQYTKVNWKTELALFARNSSLYEEVYSYRKPSRTGYYDVLYPRLKNSDPIPDSFHVYIDVSGSIVDELLNQFGSEISAIANTYPDVKITVYTFNTKIRDEFEFVDWSINKFKSGGGTNINCVMEHIERHSNLNYIVFSDMYTTPIRWESYNPVHNILWVINDNPEYVPQIGKGVHIDV